MSARNAITLLSLFALTLITTSCGSVQAVQAAPPPQSATAPAASSPNSTIITEPTLISSPQVGSYIVQSGSLYGPPSATGQGVKITGNVTVAGPALIQDLGHQSQNNILNSLEFIGPAGACAIRSVGAQVFGANLYGPRATC